jgi:hypothetical protein
VREVEGCGLMMCSGGIDEQERGGYTYISFAYGEKGPAVMVCCCPKFPLVL